MRGKPARAELRWRNQPSIRPKPFYASVSKYLAPPSQPWTGVSDIAASIHHGARMNRITPRNMIDLLTVTVSVTRPFVSLPYALSTLFFRGGFVS